jgi:hypothetical protein
MDPDDVTPVMVPNPFTDHEALLVQLSELRKRIELWRPVVETSKILVGLWENERALTPSVQSAYEMLANMVHLAVKAEGETNG